jgi:hypothetical protein
MSRWGLATLGALLVIGAAGVVLARVFGASGSRPAAMVTIASHWIAAWVLWTFVAGLALQAGVLAVYEPALFAAVALGGAIFQYQALARGASDRARTIFVGAQLAWLVLVLAQNGLFTPR